eukprot:scaffold80914_cov30-Tisochrysis_lutea.AAC.5
MSSDFLPEASSPRARRASRSSGTRSFCGVSRRSSRVSGAQLDVKSLGGAASTISSPLTGPPHRPQCFELYSQRLSLGRPTATASWGSTVTIEPKVKARLISRMLAAQIRSNCSRVKSEPLMLGWTDATSRISQRKMLPTPAK